MSSWAADTQHQILQQGEGTFIPRLGRTSPRVEDLLRARHVPLTAHRLLGFQDDPQLDLIGHDRAIVLDPACQFNQVAPERRPSGFDALDFAWRGRPYDPERSLTRAVARTYVESVLLAEAERGATILLPPAHHARGPGSIGRRNEITLQRVAADVFREESLRRPSGPGGPERQLFANIVVHLRSLCDPMSGFMLTEYRHLDADGYWVSVADLSEHSAPDDVAAAAEWLFQLQAVSRKPVVLVGAKNLHLAFLVSGLAGACLGLGRHEQVPWPRGPSRGARRPERVFHPRTLSNVAANAGESERRSVAARAFEQFPCGCGQHHPAEVPSGEEKVGHTLLCRDAQARRGTQGSIAEREGKFREKLSRSFSAAARVGAGELTALAWHAVAQGRHRATYEDAARVAAAE